MTPARWTVRLAISMKKRAWRHWSQTLSTAKQSVASIWAACWRTNRCQVVWSRRGAGGMPWLRRILATCVWEIRKPNLSASP